MLLCYITDRHSFPGGEKQQRRQLLLRIAAAASAGVDYIQLREKDLAIAELELLTRNAVAAVRSNSACTRLLINGRTDVALACDADGVHLPANELTASEVRAIWMRVAARPPIIGVSAHSIDQVRYAEAHGADFALLAPIFEKPNTDIRGLGPALLSVACRGAQPPDNTESAPTGSFPVLALGGVDLSNALACLRAGASGVAGIRLFQEGEIRDRVRALRGMDA